MSENFGIVTVPVIVVLCLLIGKAWKTSARLDDKWIPCVCGASGLILGVLIWLTDGIYHVEWFGIGDPWMAAPVGVVGYSMGEGTFNVYRLRLAVNDANTLEYSVRNIDSSANTGSLGVHLLCIRTSL